MIKLLLSMIAVSLLGLSATACGDTGKHLRSAAAEVNGTAAPAKPSAKYIAPARDVEGDYDDPRGTYYDGDDADVIAFGHSAGIAERRAISTLIARYDAASVKHEGAAACRMLNPVLAEVVAETYGTGQPQSGKTCAEVVSAYFRRVHSEVVIEDTRVTVGDIRIEGDRGFAMLGQPGVKPRRDMPIKRDHGVWTINDVLNTTLP